MSGPYAVYIVPAYLATAAVFLGLMAWAWLDRAARRRELAALEAQGVRRRSQATRDGGDD